MTRIYLREDEPSDEPQGQCRCCGQEITEFAPPAKDADGNCPYCGARMPDMAPPEDEVSL